MDKRRRKRVQGSWAARTTNPSRPREMITNPSPIALITQPDIDGEKKFVFQEGVIKTVKRAPTERVIAERGRYEISMEPSGVSIVEYNPGFLSQDETEWMFEQLQTEIPWRERDIKIKGEFHQQPRLTAWFGDFSYTYSGLTLNPYQWSPLLNILREKIAKDTGEIFNSMLANLYRHGKDSVDWHSDDELSLGAKPIIASLSFGDTRNFELRKKPPQGDDFSSMQHIKIPLTGGSLLIMKGATQEDWQHRVPKEYHDRGARINLTFRNISPPK